MSIKKQYLKSKPVCKVTFRLPEDAAGFAESANIVGEFNNWNIYATPMRKLKNGSFTVTIDLEPNREYQFRYLLDDEIWENDGEADKYVSHPYGDGENSVVVL
jgi:1,4-alpha-glucan branching enzyme